MKRILLLAPLAAVLLVAALAGGAIAADRSAAMEQHMRLMDTGNPGMMRMMELMDAGNPGMDAMMRAPAFQMPPAHP